MKMSPVIFREYDIRGVVDSDYDAEFAERLGQAYVTFYFRQFHKKPTLTLGHDARESCPKLISALSKGIRSSGGNVILLGLITSPISYFSTFSMKDVDGAIMVTGSHNPPEYNGFKISVGKSTIFGEEIQQLKKIINDNDFISAPQGFESRFDIFPSYLERYKNEFGQLRPIPLVLDCGNGAGGCIARRLYESVGLNPEILFEEPDGRFPNHHPDPTVAENLVDLIRKVRETNARVGIGFDGDADRIGVVDDKGSIILGDELMALYSRFILKELPGKPIVGDVKCSDRVFSYIEKCGGKPIMWKTGHSLVKEKIKVEKSPFGGELSGHIFFADRNYGYDDALYAGLRVVEILSKTGKSISELLADLPPSFNTPEIRIDTTEEKKHLIVEKLKMSFENRNDCKVNLIDGIRVSFPCGWALARASNTQPVLVLRFEADTESNLQWIRNQFDKIVESMI